MSKLPVLSIYTTCEFGGLEMLLDTQIKVLI